MEGKRIKEKYSDVEGVVEKMYSTHIMVKWDNGLRDIVRKEYYKHYVLLEEVELCSNCS